MGNVGCKYCDCQTEKMEDMSEEMKIQYNTPIIIAQNNLENKNKDNNEENESKNKHDYHNLTIKINSDIDSIQKENISNEISTNNIESNVNNNHNFISEMLKANNIKDNIIEESINNIELSNKKDNNNTNIYSNNKENKNDDNNKENLIVNKEVVIEENVVNNNEKLKEVKISQLHITSEKEAKNKIKNYEIDKIQFGLEKIDKEKLNKEQQKLYNEAVKNLKQFYPPQGNEVIHIQKNMSNILINLKNLINGINFNSNSDDVKYILLNGNLNKMINYEINAHKPTMYSERFCVLYPRMLKYYKSRVQFLKNLKPICILPINQISAINIAKPKKSPKKTYHLILCNKFGIQKDFDNSILFNLFDNNELNDYLVSSDINESLLIFTSEDEKEVYKWYIVIQFLIEFSKLEK